MRVLGWIAAFSVAGLVLITFVDVLGRYVFAAPLPGSFELTEYLLAVTIFAALPFVSRDDRHIKVDIITSLLTAKHRHLAEQLSRIMQSIILFFMMYVVLFKAIDLYELNDVTTYLRLPIYPLAFAIATSCGLSAIVEMMAFRQALGKKYLAEESK